MACVLYETLAGQPPFTGPTVDSVVRQHLTVNAPPPRALAKDHADRFSGARGLADALSVQAITEGSPLPRKRKPPTRSLWALAAVFALVVTVITLNLTRRSGAAANCPIGDRPQYGGPTQPFGIGINHVSSDGGIWIALPDLVTSVLLTGQQPEVLRAVRFTPFGVQEELEQLPLRSEVTMDPRRGDLYRLLIEERGRYLQAAETSGDALGTMQFQFKIMANSTYGITAEHNAEALSPENPHRVKVYGLDDVPFVVRTTAPEQLGHYACPVIATLTTAAGSGTGKSLGSRARWISRSVAG